MELVASSARTSAVDWIGVLTAFFQAVALAAALGTLAISYRTLKEGRGVIEELKKLTTAARAEVEAENEVIGRLKVVADESASTAESMVRSVAQSRALADLESVVRVAEALAEVREAVVRVRGGQPEVVFVAAKERLRAAMISRTRDWVHLSSMGVILGANTAAGAEPHVDTALADVTKEMEAARERFGA